jgi:hypothetical protein
MLVPSAASLGPPFPPGPGCPLGPGFPPGRRRLDRGARPVTMYPLPSATSRTWMSSISGLEKLHIRQKVGEALPGLRPGRTARPPGGVSLWRWVPARVTQPRQAVAVALPSAARAAGASYAGAGSAWCCAWRADHRERLRRRDRARGAGRRAPPAPWPQAAVLRAGGRAGLFPGRAARHRWPVQGAPGRAARGRPRPSAVLAASGGPRVLLLRRAAPWRRQSPPPGAALRTTRHMVRAACGRGRRRTRGGRFRGAAALPVPPSERRRPTRLSRPRRPRSAGRPACVSWRPSLLPAARAS